MAAQLGLAPEPRKGPDMQKDLRDFDPFLQGVEDIAKGKDKAGIKVQIEEVLPRLEEKGWKLSDAVRVQLRHFVEQFLHGKAHQMYDLFIGIIP